MTKCNCGSGLESDYRDRHGCAACRRVSTQAIIDASKYACVREGQRVRLAQDGDRVVVSEMLVFGNKQEWEWVPAHPALVERFRSPVIVDAAGIPPPRTDALPPPGPSTFVADLDATTRMVIAYSRDTTDRELVTVCAYEHGKAVDDVRQKRWGIGSTGHEDENPVRGIAAEPRSYHWPDGADFPWLPLGQPTVEDLCQTAMWLRWLEVQWVAFEVLQGRPPADDSRLLASAISLGLKGAEVRYLPCATETGGRFAVAVEGEPGKIPTRSGIRLRFREEMTVERDAAGRVRVIDDYSVHVTPGLVSYRPE